MDYSKTKRYAYDKKEKKLYINLFYIISQEEFLTNNVQNTGKPYYKLKAIDIIKNSNKADKMLDVFYKYDVKYITWVVNLDNEFGLME